MYQILDSFFTFVVMLFLGFILGILISKCGIGRKNFWHELAKSLVTPQVVAAFIVVLAGFFAYKFLPARMARENYINDRRQAYEYAIDVAARNLASISVTCKDRNGNVYELPASRGDRIRPTEAEINNAYAKLVIFGNQDIAAKYNNIIIGDNDGKIDSSLFVQLVNFMKKDLGYGSGAASGVYFCPPEDDAK